MANYLRQMAASRVHNSNLNTQIRFHKSGTQIVKSIKNLVEGIEKDVQASLAEIEDICKKRDVTVQEVLDGAEDHEKYEAYSMKVSSSMVMQTRTALETLQKDLDTLRSKSNLVATGKRQIVDLERVANNISQGADFELSYDELVQFGF